MKKEKRKINFGEEFQENKKMEQGEYYKEFKTLRECYEKWSDTKERVYNYYRRLLNENADKVENYGIRSYNTNVIILHAIVEKENKKYYLVITPIYNWFNELGE